MNGTPTEKPDGWVNGAFKPIWDRGRGYSSVMLYPGDMLALGCAFHLAHQVLIPAQGMERKVLVLALAKASSCSDLETAKELYANGRV